MLIKINHYLFDKEIDKNKYYFNICREEYLWINYDCFYNIGFSLFFNLNKKYIKICYRDKRLFIYNFEEYNGFELFCKINNKSKFINKAKKIIESYRNFNF